MARYIITGGSGFVGRSLSQRLRRDGHEVLVATRGRHKDDDEQHWIEYDMRDRATIANLLQAQADGIFHLAWSTSPATAESDPASDVQVNLVGTVDFFQAMTQSPETPIVFISSGGTVYGRVAELPIAEGHPLQPIGVYGATKAAAERYASIFRQNAGLDIRIARLSNPFGARQSAAKLQGAASIFTRKILAGDIINVWGDGRVIRDYVDVEDAADAIRAIMESAQTTNAQAPTYNVGSGEGITLIELLEIIADSTGIEPLVEFGEARAFDIPANILNIDKIRATLGWKPKRPMKEALVEMIRSMVETGAGR
ncbi:MAG: NAD-dependent epimerase/dehydratase family protein [Devosia sp.]|nr:NAD-dependent epimerase/dehydratase family protein [Devosia sp.]